LSRLHAADGVENEGNNILKNHGYNLEHNFGHGENHLCKLLLSLNLLAFLFHTVLDLVNHTYQKVRELLVTRTSFFNDMSHLKRQSYLLKKLQICGEFQLD
jgi:hypothetical protein